MAQWSLSLTGPVGPTLSSSLVRPRSVVRHWVVVGPQHSARTRPPLLPLDVEPMTNFRFLRLLKHCRARWRSCHVSFRRLINQILSFPFGLRALDCPLVSWSSPLCRVQPLWFVWEPDTLSHQTLDPLTTDLTQILVWTHSFLLGSSWWNNIEIKIKLPT